MKILVVEDERSMATLLKNGLGEEQHSVFLAFDGVTGLDMAEGDEFDAVILDIMLPRMDGLELLRRLRTAGNCTPVLMLTARDAIADIVRGLDLGADDYLIKPFSFEELLARLRSVARRGSSPRPTLLQIADLVLDPVTQKVTRGGQELHLTLTEFRLLEFLMRRADRAVARDTITDAIWGTRNDVEDNTLDVFISLLRTKVDKSADLKLIHTIRGVGYSVREN